MAKRRRSMVLIMFFLFLASVFCTGEIGMMPAETTMVQSLSLIHIPSPRDRSLSRMPSSA